jgi:cytochrome bd-type quinol oxidase subunit 2
MSNYLLKSLIAVVFLGVALTSFFSMMSLMGKAERKGDAAKLLKVHRASGIVFLVLLAPLAYFGASFLRELGEGLTARAVFHFVLAAFLLAVVLLKVLVVRVYKQFAKHAPALGMAIFILTVVIFLITAGYFFLRGGVLD